MAAPRKSSTGLAKALIYSLLAFFVVPAATYGFSAYVLNNLDAAYYNEVQRRISSLPGQTEALQNQARLLAPSNRCSLTFVYPAQGAKLCEQYSPIWQFYTVNRIAWWTIIGGAAVFAGIFVLACLAFLSSRAPAYTFLLGWRTIMLATTAEVVIQGVFAIWLSYWVSSYFFKIYIVKLIGLVAIAVISAAAYAVIWMFKRIPAKNEVSGVLLTGEAEPKLWARVRALAAKAGTASPDHIVAGIDANFFVTQAPLTLDGQEIKGRTLFVSLPLLRLFSEEEADAVLAHELAHFHGGDTKWSSVLGPKLQQFDIYMFVMHVKKVFVAAPILRLYRILFEFALKRASRQREFIADGAAAGIVSGRALVNALIKFIGYATYRKEVEARLFSHGARHEGELSIARQVASGLAPFAASPQFAGSLRLANVPHPFDSHPSLAERMANAGFTIEEGAYPGIITAAPTKTWAEDIASIDAIEAKLWNRYETAFAGDHERNLAFRYQPSNAEEEALVLKYFPPVKFTLKRGGFTVTYAGIELSGPIDKSGKTLIPWSQISSLKFKESFPRGYRLIVGHPKTSRFGGQDTTTLILAGLGQPRLALQNTLSQYWGRHKIMTKLNGPRL